MGTEIEVPKNLRDFKIALGKAILVYLFDMTGMETPAYLLTKPTENRKHIQAAEHWISHHHEELKALAFLARRAEKEPDVHASLMADLMKDLSGVTTFLKSARPQYISELFFRGTTQEDDKALRDFLRLIQQIPHSLPAQKPKKVSE